MNVTREYLSAPVAACQPVQAAEETSPHPSAPGRGITRSVLLSWAHRAALDLLRRATQREEDGLKALESAFYFHVSLMAKYPFVPQKLLAWYSQTDDARVRSRIANAIRHYRSRLSRLVARAQRQGLVRSDIDPRTAADLFVGMIQALALRMNAGIVQPETLLKDAASTFPFYLDGLRNAAVQTLPSRADRNQGRESS